MATPVECLLRETLSKNATYQTIQLLKDGQLGQAAVIVLKARRRMIVPPSLSLFLMVIAGIVLQVFTIGIVESPKVQSAGVLVMFPLLGLMSVSIMVQAQVAVSRLETLLLIWLQEPSESSSEDRDALWLLLSKQSFGRY